MTADGVLVMEHDTDLMKQAQDPRMITETKYEDLKDVDIGSFFGPEYAGEHLAKLHDFLELAHDKIPLIVEFKHQPGSNMVERVVATVRETDMQDQVTLMSLNIEEVRQVQKLAPEIKVGYFVSVEVGDLRLLDVDVIGAKDGMVDHVFVHDIQNKGAKVYVWTVDDPVRILELALFGVDGIITNDPNATADILKRLADLTPEQRLLLRFKKIRDILRKNYFKKTGNKYN
jgi:glycerophosphoryl diester phosphodiesterase